MRSLCRYVAIFALPGLATVTACGSDVEPGPGEEKVQAGEAEDTARMIDLIKEISLERYPAGEIKRFNQSKSLGCFDATFSVADGLPQDLRQGLFAEPNTWRARLRFASATEFDDREKDFRGLSIKLFDVPGEPLWGEPGEQDFLLNSHPALFAANPRHFREFIEATRDDARWRYFINPAHWYSLKVVLQGRERIDNPFAIRYWSTTPYRFGADPATAVKYSTRPCETPPEQDIEPAENFLSEAMAKQLEHGPVCLEFMVQFQTDVANMPIEDASVAWDESDSPFRTVATIMIEDQDFDSPANAERCEMMRFNPWQSLAAHRPLGGVNRARRPIYSEIGNFRIQDRSSRRR